VIKNINLGIEIVFAIICPLGLATMASLFIPLPWWEGSKGRGKMWVLHPHLYPPLAGKSSPIKGEEA
jgi:hypothetical protein